MLQILKSKWKNIISLFVYYVITIVFFRRVCFLVAQNSYEYTIAQWIPFNCYISLQLFGFFSTLKVLNWFLCFKTSFYFHWTGKILNFYENEDIKQILTLKTKRNHSSSKTSSNALTSLSLFYLILFFSVSFIWFCSWLFLFHEFTFRAFFLETFQKLYSFRIFASCITNEFLFRIS